ncbi:hypothetical protein BMF94_3585 [Rhodotorula taiwanensis]|uniref:Chitin-binding type-4 domain-containing protein n=1 Tax=Rhodotorula taiwanensis TaxID=741276 RepID=A0A2S5B957_9BASI|nr:hypothetical protein BMF94_3585 [Rhodotorula taiwanensis]
MAVQVLPLLAALAPLVGNLPHTSESGQTGYNDCGTTDSPSSMCQTAFVNSVQDFCLWAPPTPGGTIGDTEELEVAWCTATGHGARVMPEGTVHSAHYLVTPHYTQITGTGDFTNINIAAGDAGGELDPHGATGNGNPIGSLVFANGEQIHEWTSISDSEFCFRICHDAPDAWLWCQHIYDLQGCAWNEPGNYGDGFDTCQGDSTEYPPGVYNVNGQLSTYQQSQGAAPTAHDAGASSNCQAVATVGGAAANYAAVPTTTSSAVPSSALSSSAASKTPSASSGVSQSSGVSASSSWTTSTVSTPTVVSSTTVSSASAVKTSVSTVTSSPSVVKASSSAASTSSVRSNVQPEAAAASATPHSGAQRIMTAGASLLAVAAGAFFLA